MQGSAPVKFIASFLTNDKDLREHALHLLTDRLGKADHISEWYPFDNSTHYSAEMGDNLVRSFVSFEVLQPPEKLPDIKALTIQVEDKFRENGKRRINIDPGYVDHFKIVLASSKFATHRLAVAKSCYVDLLMYYDKGTFKPLPWCYPDLAGGTYEKDMLEIRKIFKSERTV